MDKYKVYNETKNQWEFVIADAEPTSLPDNPGDTMRAGSATIVENNIQLWDGVTVRDLTLDNYKKLATNKIDYQSGVLLAPGATHGGFNYSVTPTAIGKLTGLDRLIEKGDVTFPVSVARIDEYKTTFSNQVDWDNFITSIGQRVDTVLEGGADLKDQIMNAVDEAGVDAVNDTRT